MSDALPVVLGYVPACLTFGIVGAGFDLDPLVVMGLSALVYAGASQFVGAQLLALGATVPVLLGTVALINLRYVFLAAALRARTEHVPRARRALLGPGLTEEVFAVTVLGRRGPAGAAALPWSYLAGAQVLPYLTALLSTFVGLHVGRAVPDRLLPALTTSLHALLVALLLPLAMASLRAAAVVVLACLTSVSATPLVGPTWAVLAAVLVAPTAVVALARVVPALRPRTVA